MNTSFIRVLTCLFLCAFSAFAEDFPPRKSNQMKGQVEEFQLEDITPSISTLSKGKTLQSWTNFDLPPFGANLFQGNFKKLEFTGFNPNYMLSVDDELILHFWGAKALDMTIKVDQQGNIFIPDVGNIKVLGVKQKDLNDHISNQVKKVYNKNVGVYVQLSSSKKVKIFVSGFVKNPGMYEGMASGSVFSYVDSAGGIDLDRGSFRSIEIVRHNKKVHEFDLYDFLISGNIDFIQLHEGDVIQIGEQKGVIAVTGKVRNENHFELKRNVISGSDVIKYANPLDSATNVHVIRRTKESTQNFFLTIEEFRTFQVFVEDKIEFFTHARPETITVIVEGEHEGNRRLVLPHNKTTLKDALDLVTPSDRSAMDSIILYRESAAERQKIVFNQVLDAFEQKLSTYSPISAEDAKIHAEEIRTVENFIKKARNHQPNGMVSIYNEKGKMDNVYLEDRDIISIPKKTNLVATFGYVNSPTYIAYVHGKNIKYYIKSSGGLQNGADKSHYLVRKLNGNVVKVKASYKPEAGDEIIVLPKVSMKMLQFSKDITQLFFQMAVTARFFVLL